MEEKNSLYKCPNHTGNLNNMRLNNKWCDVTIRVNEREIYAHKVVLAANLKYFESMLSNDSLQESKGCVINMQSVDEADLELFVSYAYTGEILLTDGNALNFLELANYLSEDGIKKACIEFLTKHLRAEEACRAYTFADTIECSSLKNVAKTSIITNFRGCSQTSDYLDLDYQSLVDILFDGKAKSVKSQQAFFEGIMRWIMHDVKRRKICMRSLLSSIIAQLNADYMMNYLGNMAHSNDEYGIVMDLICCFHTRKIEEIKLEQVLMIMGDVGGKCSSQFYSFTEKKWSPPQTVPDADKIIYTRGAVVNNELYYVGINSKSFDLRVFNPTIKWTKVLNSSIILNWSSITACDRFLYLFVCRKSKPVWRYDPKTNSFETLTSMETTRVYEAAIFHQDSLYVLGGYDGSSIVNSVEKYDADTNKWTTLAPMCEPRWGHTAAVLDEKIYACGGESSSSVEVYDPVKNSWQLVASMNKQRLLFIVTAHEGKLYAIGGEPEKTAEVYDPSTDQWQIDETLSSGLHICEPIGGLISSSYFTDAK